MKIISSICLAGLLGAWAGDARSPYPPATQCPQPRFTGKAPPITPEMASSMSRKVSTASQKAQRELGYKVLPLKDMVKDCYDWMAAEKRI